jgi:hypothetical protein
LGRRRRRSKKNGRVSPRAVTVQPHPTSPDHGRHSDVYSIRPPCESSSVEASPAKRRVSWAPMQGSRDSLRVPTARPNRESVDTMPAASDSGWGRQESQDAEESVSGMSSYTSPANSGCPSRSASQSRSSSMVPSRPGSTFSLRPPLQRGLDQGSSSSMLSGRNHEDETEEDSSESDELGELGQRRIQQPFGFRFSDVIFEVSEPSTANPSERGSMQYSAESPDPRTSFVPQLSYVGEDPGMVCTDV